MVKSLDNYNNAKNYNELTVDLSEKIKESV